MSDVSEINWNTADIRNFKQAFGARKNFNAPSSETPYDAKTAYTQARQMLEKRRNDTALSVLAIIDNKIKYGTNSLLEELQKRGQGLSDQTNELLKKDPPDDFDNAAKELTDLTDEWVTFEARCISANNEMTAGKDDAGVRQKLADRAARLSAMLLELRKAASVKELTEAATKCEPSVDFKGLETEIGKLAQEADKKGDKIGDTLAFGDRIEVRKAQLQSLIHVVAEKSDNGNDLYRTEIEQLYGLKFEATPKTIPLVFGLKITSVSKKSMEDSFPYKKFLDALAMVPPEHSMNSELQKVVYENLKGGGADYSKYEKRIRIDPNIRDDLDESYKDPETGKITPVDKFSISTLHEIGHAVDAAYGVMEKHQAKKGSGGWQETDPIIYMLPQYKIFCGDMARSGVRDAPFEDHYQAERLRTLIASVVVGSMKLSEARTEVESFWQWAYEETLGKAVQEQVDEIINRVNSLTIELFMALPEDRKPGNFKQAQEVFSKTGGVANLLAQLTKITPAVFAEEEFWRFFKLLVEKPKASGTDIGLWFSTKVEEYKQRAAKDKENAVALWVNTTMKCLPKKPLDLKDYVADARPWTRDLSQEVIGEQPASQEAYKGSAPWWRYSGEDRKSTFVTNYQWRAPFEWFAELYAITWFKQVEPPAGVGNEVRQYMFGGHITPDKAV